VLAILRWIENPRGRLAGYRALRLLPGIGPAIAARWLDSLENAPDPVGAMKGFQAPAAATHDWSSLLVVYEGLRVRGSDWPAEIDAVLDWYQPQLERLYDDGAVRLPDLAQLRRISATYPSRERFLTELTLDPPAATSAEAGAPLLDEDYLTLSTIHSAKGQEWAVVQVLNCVDGCIPSDMATGSEQEIEEERRLLYVAMTRARDYLTLLLPQRFHVRQQSGMGDRHVYASRSRFLTDAVCAAFDHRSWPAASREQSVGVAREGARIDLAALMRNAWTSTAR
jgi:DNA helicase II / ATP-dependent DNA helicase PcrA